MDFDTFAQEAGPGCGPDEDDVIGWQEHDAHADQASVLDEEQCPHVQALPEHLALRLGHADAVPAALPAPGAMVVFGYGAVAWLVVEGDGPYTYVNTALHSAWLDNVSGHPVWDTASEIDGALLMPGGGCEGDTTRERWDLLLESVNAHWWQERTEQAIREVLDPYEVHPPRSAGEYAHALRATAEALRDLYRRLNGAAGQGDECAEELVSEDWPALVPLAVRRALGTEEG